MPRRLRRTAQTPGDVAVRTFLDHPQPQQFTIPLRQRRECSTLRLRERLTVVDSVERGIRGEQTGDTEPPTGTVLDPALPQRLAQDVSRDPEQPRQRGHVALVSEPASPKPSAREDFGCQIGGMLADPRPCPGKHLSSVSVVDLLEGIGSARAQELRVRRRSEIASHNLYLTAPQKMCHARRSLRDGRGELCGREKPRTALSSPRPVKTGFIGPRECERLPSERALSKPATV